MHYRHRKTVLLLFTLGIFLSGCQQKSVTGSGTSGQERRTSSESEFTAQPGEVTDGFSLTLSEGSPDSDRPEQVKTVTMTPLSEGQVQALLQRLPAFKAKPEIKDFALREKSLPPPRPGETVSQPFPPPLPPTDAPTVDSGPLEVLRFAPEGEVPIAPQLSVTFNQPMVAVTSHQELAKLKPPVKLTPEPPGTWRWIGTRTLLFDPRGEVSEGSTQQARFPMATEYTVEVPSGTKASSGSALAEGKTWSFQTPTVKMTGSAPQGGPHNLDPLMWMTFDQDIDPWAVLKTIKVTGGSNPVEVRMATDEEMAGTHLSKQPAKRWLAFKATGQLKPGTSYTVTLGPDTPSAEGPLLTKEAQSYSFSTYDPLRVQSHSCGYGECPPLSPFYISFNNPLDMELFEPGMVKVSPDIPRMRVEANGSGIQIRGETKGRTTYTVTLDPKIPDAFGQTLGESRTLTFKVGSAKPQLSGPGELLVTLDPNDQNSYPIYCINESKLRVTVHSVEPKDWREFQERLARETERDPFVPPGQQVVKTTIDTGAKPDELTEVRIDLKPALVKSKGMAVVVVESPGKITNWWDRKRIVKWVQVTDIGLSAAVDQQSMQVMTTELGSGKTLAGVNLSLLDPSAQTLERQTSNNAGSATLALSDSHASLLVAEKDGDVSILPQQAHYYGYGGWNKVSVSDQLRWFVVDDRKMYRPDEKVSVKGWVRRWQAGPKGDIVALEGELGGINWTVTDAVGNEVLKGLVEPSKDGSFNLDFTLPKTINLGHTNLSLNASSRIGGGYHNHSFQVQEFRRPEFEVTAGMSPDATLFGESATATVEAKYFAGGGLPGAPVTWQVTATAGSYSPPGFDGFTFGTWTPWWDWHGWRGSPSTAHLASESFQSVTDSSGTHHLKLDFGSLEPPKPVVVTAEASVSDVNRQAWNASSSVLVHPSQHYVGLRTEKAFVEKGSKLEIEVVACQRDGSPIADTPVEVSVWRNDYRVQRGRYQEAREDLQTQTVSASSKPIKVAFKTPNGGTYTVKARVADAEGRPNESTLTLWVSGGELPPVENLEMQQLTLVPNAKEYQAGEVAEILVQAPFAPAEGQLTLRRSGLLKTERFQMKEATTILKVPIEEGYVPNLHLTVDLVGSTKIGKTSQPAYASGSLNLSVPPLARTLEVEVKPVHPATDPGSKTSLEVVVKDAQGKPLPNAEVALFAVDEAVLVLTGYSMPNPVEVFYSQRGSDTSDYYSRKYVILNRLEDQPGGDDALEELIGNEMDGMMDGAVTAESAMPMSPSAAMREEAPMMSRQKSDAAKPQSTAPLGQAQAEAAPIAMRTDFNPTALFAPLVKTDAQGKAAVPFKLPDNLTRYRLVALATDGGKQFGKGESALVARLPLMVRPSAPRFLNFGDVFELPVVLQNQTNEPMDVQIAARAVNLDLSGAQGFSLQIPANDRVEVRFPAAADQAGKADIQVGAVGPGAAADAAEVSLPVWTPATTEAFATYGEIDEGATAQKIKPPGEVFPQFGGLEITTSSTALQGLTDAFLYLVSYPFDCAEQVSSRLLAIAALRDVLWAFEAPGMPDAEELQAQVKRDMDRLSMLQKYNGGFGFWATSPETWPYISVHVAHAMARAKEKGYEVPERTLSQSMNYLANVESHIPGWYPEDCKRMIRAYALYVRHRLGDTDMPKVKALISEAGGVTKLPLEGMGWIYYVICKDPDMASLVTEIRRHLNNSITETAGNAHFVTSYSEEAGYVVLASDRRVDGILLEAMIHDQPSNDLIPKLVRGLLAHRKRGQWGNTQDNCFVLLALDLYFQTFEKTTPDFVARIWLGEEFAGEQTFKGRQTDYRSLTIPMSYLAERGEKTLTLAKDGPGRLYYRLGMDYAPTSLKLDPADHGFAVERVYEAVDDPEDVKRDADGTWRIKAGAKVRVRLSMVAPARRYHVALVDPLPAGLEPMNPALAVTGTVPLDPSTQASRGRYWYWMGTWYEHQNMRDERVEAFTSLLWGGVYSYSYMARATTPGAFVVPPTKAEEMYAPETFGRSASDKVVVE